MSQSSIIRKGQTTPISISRPDLPVGASATISIGNLETTPASFRGSAVIKSDVEVAVLMTQIPTTVTIKARPMAGAATQGFTKHLAARRSQGRR